MGPFRWPSALCSVASFLSVRPSDVNGADSLYRGAGGSVCHRLYRKGAIAGDPLRPPGDRAPRSLSSVAHIEPGATPGRGASAPRDSHAHRHGQLARHACRPAHPPLFRLSGTPARRVPPAAGHMLGRCSNRPGFVAPRSAGHRPHRRPERTDCGSEGFPLFQPSFPQDLLFHPHRFTLLRQEIQSDLIRLALEPFQFPSLGEFLNSLQRFR